MDFRLDEVIKLATREMERHNVTAAAAWLRIALKIDRKKVRRKWATRRFYFLQLQAQERFI